MALSGQTAPYSALRHRSRSEPAVKNAHVDLRQPNCRALTVSASSRGLLPSRDWTASLPPALGARPARSALNVQSQLSGSSKVKHAPLSKCPAAFENAHSPLDPLQPPILRFY